MSNSSTYWIGMGDHQAALNALPEDMRQRTLAAGVTALVKPIEIAAKRFAKRSEDTGALRESITTKVVNYPQTGRCVGLVGPDRHYYARGKRVKNLSLLFAQKRHRPANYAHLVEFGHLIAKGGALRAKHKVELVGTGRFSASGKELKRWKKTAVRAPAKGHAGGIVPPKPFLRPAVATTAAQQSAAFAQGIERSFARAIAKAGGKA